MAKFYGKIGFVDTKETSPGIWEEEVDERDYYGDILRISHRNQVTNTMSDDITINNQISVVADPYAYENFFAIQFVRWMGKPWRITNVEIQRPRLILTLGGLYNEP
jgi:hypothetical protein